MAGSTSRPAATPSFELPITLTFEEPIGHITAHATWFGRDDARVVMIGVDADGRPQRDGITIERLPPRGWQVLSVFVGLIRSSSRASSGTPPTSQHFQMVKYQPESTP